MSPLLLKVGSWSGLIGLNGAGKSTTINEIIGLLTPYSGSINVNELTLQEDATSYRKQIGYILRNHLAYEELTLRVAYRNGCHGLWY